MFNYVMLKCCVTEAQIGKSQLVSYRAISMKRLLRLTTISYWSYQIKQAVAAKKTLCVN